MLFHIIANVADIDDILHRRWNEPYAKGADKVQEFLGKKPRKAAPGQRELLLPISGKRNAREETKMPEPKKAEKPARPAARSKKAG